MPRWTRLVFATYLSCGALAIGGCDRHEDGDTESPTHAGKPKTERMKPPPRNMPKPLPLPAKPLFAVHIADPGQAITALAELTGHTDLRGLLAELATSNPIGLDPLLARHVDLERPWSAAVVDGQLVVQLPIDRSRLAYVAKMYSTQPKLGDFGAVSLQRTASNASVAAAWLDEPNAMLTLAGNERGIATGRELAHAYGKHAVFATIDGVELRKQVPEIPFGRIGVEGKTVGDFHVAVEGLGAVEGLDKITDGALTGLLGGPDLAAGASSRYAAYQSTVKQLISEATRAVSKQNFLVRGVLEDMLKRYNTVLRSWNGRVMVGIGPKHHVLLAMGADDPSKAVGALGSLIDTANDNLDLARTFGVSVPNLRFKRNAASAAGINVHTLTVDKARSVLPAELTPLIDKGGALRVAFAGSPHAGAVMFAAGPDAAGALTRWLDHSKGGQTGAQSTAHLIAASIAVEPATLQALQGAETIAPVLALAAERAPTHAVVTHQADRYDVHVQGPLPKVDPKRIAPEAIGRGAADPRGRAQPGVAPARGMPPGRAPAAGPRAAPRSTG
jgi:hypothetical protein